MTSDELLVRLITDGSLALGWAAWLWERRRAAAVEDKVLALSVENAKAMTVFSAAIDTNTKALEQVDRTIDREMRD